MRKARIVTAVTVLTLADMSAAAQQDDAVAHYRAYVAAVRDGKVEDVLKLVEPVPKTSQPLLVARVKQAIAVEAMKKEMIAQMGPPKTGEQGWNIGGSIPYDDVLKNLKGVVQDQSTVVLLSKDPRNDTEVAAGWVVRRNGKWLIPAGLVMDLEPAAQFVEPEAEKRQKLLDYAVATTKAVEAVLQRLRKKEFKTPAEVQHALSGEMAKAVAAQGAIDE